MRESSSNRLMLMAVGLLSTAMLIFELSLTRLFALAQFYHFAFMVISLALLGMGAAGSLLSVWRGLGKSPGWWAAGFSAAVLLSYAILNLIPFDSYAIAWDRRQVLYLILTFAGAALPFLCSGVVIGHLLAADVSGLHRVYAANLVGSAAGCVLVLPLLDWFGGEGALLISAAMGIGAGLLFGVQHAAPFTVIQIGIGLALAGVLVALAVIRPDWLAIRLSPYKGLSQVLLAPEADHAISEWNTFARVDLVESRSIHSFPGLSQNALIADPPLQAGLTLDGDNLMPVTALSPEDELAHRLAEHVPQSVIGALRPGYESLLILEPGGGWDVLVTLSNGAQHVTVVEHNPSVIDILRGADAAYLYADPRVEVIQAEARTYIRRTSQTFDVIDIGLSDSFHPVTSGAYSLGEDYRYTTEAIGDYLEQLSPGGLLIMTRWLQTPPTESLRMLAAIQAALQEQGSEQPADHITAFRSLRTMTFVVAKSPLTSDEREAIRAFAASQGYDLVWLSELQSGEVNRYNQLLEPAYYEAFSSLLADPNGFIGSYEFDIRPATDNRPFFYHYFRWQQTPEVIAGLGKTWQPFGGSGYLVLVALLIIVSVLAIVLIFGPLIVNRPAGDGSSGPPGVRFRMLIYFTMLGLGFLFIEIPLAQHFILFLGHPVIALAVVLFAILLFSGLGSLTAPRWSLLAALGSLVIVAILMPVVLPAIFRLVLGWPLAARIVVSILCLAPLGVLMGVPFARGLAIIEKQAPGLIPWAWAVNGSASVISGVLAVMLALSWGFSIVLWIGAATYAVALLAMSNRSHVEWH